MTPQNYDKLIEYSFSLILFETFLLLFEEIDDKLSEKLDLLSEASLSQIYDLL
jgi:hypothetical protein